MHPTIERLWMYTVLTEKITDYSWPEQDIPYMGSDGTVISEPVSLYGDSCVGHRGSDIFPFDLVDTYDDGFTIKTGICGNSETGNILTNREVLQAFDPKVNALPYVYDTFTWGHCTPEGFDFNDAWGNIVDIARQGPRTVFEEGALQVPMYRHAVKLDEKKAAGT